MDAIKSFISRCDAYCEARGISRGTLSASVLSNAGRLQLLADGQLNIGFRTLQEASDRLGNLEKALESDLTKAKEGAL
jgi:hypothetical protein